MEQILRWSQRVLFACAIVLLGYCAYLTVESWMFQRQSKIDLMNGTEPKANTPAPIKAGDLLGRIDVERLGVSVAVVEGADFAELQHAAGHIAGTAFPGRKGNTAIAAHRDTFFWPLRNVRANDVIRVTTRNGIYRYRVVSTKIVKPDDVSILNSNGKEILTLVTCYPFYFVGSAPNRFIVRAERLHSAIAPTLQPVSTRAHLY